MKAFKRALTTMAVFVALTSPAFANMSGTFAMSPGDEVFTLTFQNVDNWGNEVYNFRYQGVTINGGGTIIFRPGGDVEMNVTYGHGSLFFQPIPNGNYVGFKSGQRKFMIENIPLDFQTLHRTFQ